MKGVEVVIEALAEALHLEIKGLLTGVREGGVADVVGKGEGFGQVFIEAEGRGDGAGDLGDFDGVGEAITEVVGVAFAEDLGFVFQAAEGVGVDDAVAITLEFVAVRVLRFGEAAAPRSRGRETEPREGHWG